MTSTAARPRRLAALERRPFAIFASAGDEERRRRPADVATLVSAAILVFVGVREHSEPDAFGQSFARMLHDLPDWSKSLLGVLFILASAYVVFVLVMAIVARDRPGLVRDLLVAAALSAVGGLVVGRAVTGAWPAIQGAFNGCRSALPGAARRRRHCDCDDCRPTRRTPDSPAGRSRDHRCRTGVGRARVRRDRRRDRWVRDRARDGGDRPVDLGIPRRRAVVVSRAVCARESRARRRGLHPSAGRARRRASSVASIPTGGRST